MAAIKRSTAAFQNSTAATTYTTTSTVAIQNGDVVIVGIALPATATNTTAVVNNTGAQAYTKLRSAQSGTTSRVDTWYWINKTGATVTSAIKITTSASTKSVVSVAVVSGANNTDPFGAMGQFEWGTAYSNVGPAFTPKGVGSLGVIFSGWAGTSLGSGMDNTANTTGGSAATNTGGGVGTVTLTQGTRPFNAGAALATASVASGIGLEIIAATNAVIDRTLFSTDFNAYSAGATAVENYGMTERWTTTNNQWKLATDGTTSEGVILQHTTNTTSTTKWERLLTINDIIQYGDAYGNGGTSANIEQVIKARTTDPSGSAPMSIYSRASGATNAAQYSYQFQTNGQTLEVSKYVNGTWTLLTSVAMTVNANQWYWMRFRLNGTSLQAKFWADGTTEPASWTLSVSDASITTMGWNGPGTYQNTGTHEYAWYSAGFNGATAPTPAAATFPPTVSTDSITAIGSSTATGGGNVTSDGGSTITERGIVWATTNNPTTANSKATATGTTGFFSANMTGLLPSTVYYVRAYAINANGTSYGASDSFVTASFGYKKILVGGVWVSKPVKRLVASTWTTKPVRQIGYVPSTKNPTYTTGVARNITLADIEQTTTPNYDAGRTMTVDTIAIHWWGDPSAGLTMDGTITYMQDPTVQVSSHFVVDGLRIVQMVDMANTAWNVLGHNPHVIGIENNPNPPAGHYETLAGLIRYIRHTYGVQFPLMGHSQFSGNSTACPGFYLTDMPTINTMAS